MILSISGQGQGVASYLADKHGWVNVSFDSVKKDIVASLFRWERHLLDGVTEESKTFLEVEDEWWTDRLEWEVVPSDVIKYVGNKMSQFLHPSVWAYHIEMRVRSAEAQGKNVVVTEAKSLCGDFYILKELGAKFILVASGKKIWYPNFYRKLEWRLANEGLELCTLTPTKGNLITLETCAADSFQFNLNLRPAEDLMYLAWPWFSETLVGKTDNQLNAWADNFVRQTEKVTTRHEQDN